MHKVFTNYALIYHRGSHAYSFFFYKALRKLDPAWQAEAEKKLGRWPKKRKDTSEIAELEHTEHLEIQKDLEGLIETGEKSSNGKCT